MMLQHTALLGCQMCMVAPSQSHALLPAAQHNCFWALQLHAQPECQKAAVRCCSHLTPLPQSSSSSYASAAAGKYCSDVSLGVLFRFSAFPTGRAKLPRDLDCLMTSAPVQTSWGDNHTNPNTAGAPLRPGLAGKVSASGAAQQKAQLCLCHLGGRLCRVQAAKMLTGALQGPCSPCSPEHVGEGCDEVSQQSTTVVVNEGRWSVGCVGTCRCIFSLLKQYFRVVNVWTTDEH